MGIIKNERPEIRLNLCSWKENWVSDSAFLSKIKAKDSREKGAGFA